MKTLKIILPLIKYRVSIAVTFTAITGYIVYSGSFDSHIFQLIIAVFLLASGTSALNECQESKYDAKMERTKMRPIPSGLITLKQGLSVSFLFIIAGTILLYFSYGAVTALLGVFNVFWYNGVYTNLKRITAFAIVPGSLVGAVPVLMGWTAAGGYVFDLTIVLIAFFLFIWQIPHFWLLMFKYSSQYEAAGFPTISQRVSMENLKRIIFSWVVATSFSSISIPLFLPDVSFVFFLIVFVLNILFVGFFVKTSFGSVQELNFKKSFISINIYMLFFMLLLMGYHIVSLN